MDNDLVENEHWLKRNWTWSVPLTILFILIAGLLLSPNSQESISAITQAYTDPSLCEKAIQKANANNSLLQDIGPIQALDPLALLEGNVIYSNENNSVKLTVRINGTKGKGKLYLTADKIGSAWQYKTIVVRTKNQKEGILILDDLK